MEKFCFNKTKLFPMDVINNINKYDRQGSIEISKSNTQ